jgi:lupus La protein
MTEEKVLKQFEFYFSDSNLPNDKFLRSQVANNMEGYVSLDVICNFKRILDITKDRELIIKALSHSKILQVDKDGKNVRRTTPLPETNSMTEKTLYVKGLPSDSTIESIEAIFKGFTVSCVRLRRNKETKEFKGSAFVEFSTQEEVDAAIKSEIKVNDVKLTCMSKKDYDLIKNGERNEKKLKDKKEKYSKELEETRKKYGINSGVVVKITGLAKTDAEEMTKILESVTKELKEVKEKHEVT